MIKFKLYFIVLPIAGLLGIGIQALQLKIERRNHQNVTDQLCLAIQSRVQMGSTRAVMEYLDASVALLQQNPKASISIREEGHVLRIPETQKGFRPLTYPCVILGRVGIEVATVFYERAFFGPYFSVLVFSLWCVLISIGYISKFIVKNAQRVAIAAIGKEVEYRLGYPDNSDSLGKHETLPLSHRFFRLEIPVLKKIRDKFLQLEQVIKDREVIINNQRTSAELGKLASQVAHDIRSPLAALDMVVGDLTSLPEENRILVRSAVNRIKDIANSLLKKNRESMKRSLGEKSTISGKVETKTAQLLSSLIDEIVTEKRLQFKDRPEIEIDAQLGANSYGIFALLQPVEFKRMISNLLNNSIEVLGDYGKVNLTLDSNLESVEIRIRDNGKGIPPEILKKLGQRGETHGKEGGSGLGLFHARTVVESWGGTLKVESEVGKGTEIIINLPKANPPTWFVPELILTENSVLAVLDDDNSIKEIWRQRLAQLNIDDRSVEVKYFSNPDDFEDWFRTSDPLKSHLFLLDYEIIGNKRSGLDLAESLGIGGKTILVSSRWDEKAVLDRCVEIGVRLIPKGLAGFVPIVFRKPQRKLDAILLDDDDLVISTWSNVAKKHKKNLLAFVEPQSFFTGLENVDRSSPIFIDSNLKDGIKGQDLIPKVRAFGFHTVYLATGYEREKFADVSGIAAVKGKDPPKEIGG